MVAGHHIGHFLGVMMTENTKTNMKKPRKRNHTKIYAKIRPHANFQVNMARRAVKKRTSSSSESNFSALAGRVPFRSGRNYL